MSSEAIILKKIPIREYDELVVCYTKNTGKQTYLAKSVRRHSSKQLSHLDTLNWVDFVLVCPKNSSSDQPDNGRSIITQSVSIKTFHNLKENPKGMALAFFILDIFDKIVFDGEYDEDLWNFLTGYLIHLNNLAKQKNTDWKKEFNELKNSLLKVLGYNRDQQIQELARSKFHSLQLIKNMIGLD